MKIQDIIQRSAVLAEACWKGYHKEGNKKMFGKTYPNCVKNKNESLETYVRKGECPGCGGHMVHEGQINEKQDACYHKVKSRYKVWPSAYASGALVQCRKKGAANWGNSNESITQEEYDQLDENLKKWFDDKWVRFGPDGKIRGDCARGDNSEGKPKCLPQSKAHALGKAGRASAGARKRRQDPDADRSGAAINVNTKKKSNEGVAEGSLEEIDRRGFLRGMGAAAMTGAAGGVMAQNVNYTQYAEIAAKKAKDSITSSKWVSLSGSAGTVGSYVADVIHKLVFAYCMDTNAYDIKNLIEDANQKALKASDDIVYTLGADRRTISVDKANAFVTTYRSMLMQKIREHSNVKNQGGGEIQQEPQKQPQQSVQQTQKAAPQEISLSVNGDKKVGDTVTMRSGPYEGKQVQITQIIGLRDKPTAFGNTHKATGKIVESVNQDLTEGSLEETYDGDEFFEAYGELWYNEDQQLDEAEYHGRSVPLGKPMQGDVKKFKVYVKDPSTGNVKKVNFGDPNMRIKKSNPARRRSFRARHNCDNPGPRTMARFWSCRKW